MKRYYIQSIYTAILFASFLVFSCNKDDNESPSDPNYPTRFEKLNSIEYENRMNQYWQRNPNLESDLNQFGFCASTANHRELNSPGPYKEITPAEAKAIVRSFIHSNPVETGITDTTKVDLTVVSQFVSSNYYVSIVQTKGQMVDTLAIRNTTIGFRLENEHVVNCINNWFPNVYVPSSFFITPEKAIESLVGSQYTLPSISGSITGNVTEGDLAGASIETIIIQFPDVAALNNTQRIELRIVYKIYLPQVFTLFYVDVMFGNILDSDPTISS